MKEGVISPEPLVSDHPEVAFLGHSLAADIQSMLQSQIPCRVHHSSVMVGDHTALGVAYLRPLQASSTHRAD